MCNMSPSIRKNLIYGSLLCWDGYKLVSRSNECIISKYETFIGKSYERRCMFYLSFYHACFNSMNRMSHDNKINVWYSCHCHINFGWMMRFAEMNLISNFDLVKGS